MEIPTKKYKTPGSQKRTRNQTQEQHYYEDEELEDDEISKNKTIT